MPLGITVAGESRPAHTAGPIEVEPCGGGWVLRSDAVGRDHWGNVGLATQRDAHPVHGGGVSPETARANALLWAGAAGMLQAIDDSLFALNECSEAEQTEVVGNVCQLLWEAARVARGEAKASLEPGARQESLL